MGVSNLLQRSMYHHEPPAYESRNDVNPTLLVSWWCTIFALTTILIRLFGRWIRTEKLFREDKIMAYSIIPLLIRMGFVHVILIYGTNNTVTDGLTRTQILHRGTGSKLVLPARIFYASFIWVAKLTVLEFLKRTIQASWVKSYEIGLRLIYGFLIATFVAVVIGTLAECHPFAHYWQVVPDPGPQCREGLVQLITMGVCDIVTDIVLVIVPIPLIMSSSMPLSKKLSLIALFLLSIILIAITAYRIPSTVARNSAQPYRSLLASLEILAAAFVSNAVVIGSFIRDKGVKKVKFRAPSIDGGNSNLSRVPTRSQSIAMHHWGSDEDLVREMGMTLPPLLRRSTTNELAPRAPPVAMSGSAQAPLHEIPERHPSMTDSKWAFDEENDRGRRNSDSSASSNSTDPKLPNIGTRFHEPGSPGEPNPDEQAQPATRMSFFDVGGLVNNPASDNTPSGTSREESVKEAPAVISEGPRPRSGSRAFLTDIGGLLSRYREEGEPTTSTGLDVPRKRHGSSSSYSKPKPKLEKKSTSKSPDPSSRSRRFSRSPRPSRVFEEADDDERKEKKLSTGGGPEDMGFSDAGGLLG